MSFRPPPKYPPYPGENRGQPFIHYDGFSYKFDPNKMNRREARTETTINSLARRDGMFCKACRSTDNLTIDHRIPRSLGGSNKLANKQLLCFRCNNLKANFPPGDNGWWPNVLMYFIEGSDSENEIWNNVTNKFEVANAGK